MQQLLNEDPVPPSRLQPKVSRDIETICLKCLHKEPSRRYATAVVLAEDLRCFVEKRPIRARPTPPWERIAKWTRRRPALAGLFAVSALAFVGLAAVMFAYNARLRRERANADGQRDIARKAQARSEADFRLALDAVKRFYTDVSENRLVSVPAAGPLRVELLERARAFYEQIARPARPSGGRGRARPRGLAAGCDGERGACRTGGDRPHGGAIALQEQLAARYPDRSEFRSDLCAATTTSAFCTAGTTRTSAAPRPGSARSRCANNWFARTPMTCCFAATWRRALNNLANWYRQLDGQSEARWPRFGAPPRSRRV